METYRCSIKNLEEQISSHLTTQAKLEEQLKAKSVEEDSLKSKKRSLKSSVNDLEDQKRGLQNDVDKYKRNCAESRSRVKQVRNSLVKTTKPLRLKWPINFPYFNRQIKARRSAASNPARNRNSPYAPKTRAGQTSKTKRDDVERANAKSSRIRFENDPISRRSIAADWCHQQASGDSTLISVQSV